MSVCRYTSSGSCVYAQPRPWSTVGSVWRRPMHSDRDLERFVEAQSRVFDSVRSELKAGRKASHWMWFIFPQLRGLGRSATAHYFGIASSAEARAYLEHPVLGPRLRECVEFILGAKGTAHEIFGWPDDLKLRSSLTLFAAVAPEEPIFHKALDRFFAAEPDPFTLAALSR